MHLSTMVRLWLAETASKSFNIDAASCMSSTMLDLLKVALKVCGRVRDTLVCRSGDHT